MLTYKKVASLAIFGLLCSAQALLAQSPKSSESVDVPADQVQYQDVGIGKLQLGTVWGDSTKGAYGAFLRIPAGFVSPVHLHTGDYYGVVVEGTVVNFEEGHPEVPLGPGSYFFQRGKIDHVTKCSGSTDCLFYLSQSEPADFIIHKK
jgi:hypothetical protein